MLAQALPAIKMREELLTSAPPLCTSFTRSSCKPVRPMIGIRILGFKAEAVSIWSFSRRPAANPISELTSMCKFESEASLESSVIRRSRTQEPHLANLKSATQLPASSVFVYLCVLGLSAHQAK